MIASQRDPVAPFTPRPTAVYFPTQIDEDRGSDHRGARPAPPAPPLQSFQLLSRKLAPLA